MKTYKTWEMIKELTENPSKKFRLVNGAHVVGVNPETGAIIWDDGVPLAICSAMLGDRWEEIKPEPLSLIDVLKLVKRNPNLTLEFYYDDCFMFEGFFDDILLELSDWESPRSLASMLLYGEWYIE